MNQITDPRRLLAPPDHPVSQPRGHGRSWLMGGVAVMLLGTLAWGVWRHVQTSNQAHATQQAQQDDRPSVRVTPATSEPGPVEVALPGTTAPLDIAHLYARATGFVGERLVDIGDRVKPGDLLLRINAPDLDAQLAQAAAQLGQTRAAQLQAQASLESARSNIDLARVTNQRTSTLAGQGWETRQNADNTRANVAAGTAGVDSAQAGITVAEANVAAQMATVQRLQALVGYERVTAPIGGVVTARSVDMGDLVNADAGGGTALLTVQNDDVLRVQVYVPQSDAVALRDGLDARVTVPELPGQIFPGRVARSSVALDPTSRTVLTEIDVPNADHRLRPGLYVQVRIEVPRATPAVTVPDEAVILNADGPQVAVLDGDHVDLRRIEIARDFGTTVEIRSGLHGGEQVVLSPPAQLVDGAKVKVEQPAGPKPGG